MADYKNNSLSTVITSAISDFNNIFDALSTVKAVDTTGAALSTDTTGVKTSEYSTIISSQLVRVGDLKRTDLTLSDGVVSNFKGVDTSVSAVTGMGLEGNTLTFKIAMPAAGYYDTTSSLIYSAVATAVSATGSLIGNNSFTYTPGEDGALGLFKFNNEDNKFIGSVTIGEGSYSIDVKNPTFAPNSTDSSLTTTLAASSADNINTKVALAVAEEDADDYVKVDIESNSKISGKVSATADQKFTAGYISSVGDAPTIAGDLKDLTGPSNTASVYIPKGSISNIGFSGGEVTFTNNNDYQTVVAGEGDEAYTLTAALGEIDLTGTITTGWIDSTNTTIGGKIDATSTDVKIKKGSITEATAAQNTIALSAAGDIDTASEAADAYSITVSGDTSKLVDATVVPGFIAGVTKVSNHVSVTDKVLKIAKANVKAITNLTGISYTDADGILSATAETGSQYYTITPKVSATSTFDATSTDGYLKAAEASFSSTNLDAVEGDAFYVKKGKVTAKHELSIAGDTAGLTTSKPSGTEGTDYVTIKTNCNVTLAEGYVKTADVVEDNTGTKNYYMPKATIGYTTDAAGGKFVEVKTPGFLTSGVIEVIEGTIDYADVKAILSATDDSILTSTGNTGAYKISISKSISATGSGYIDAENGTLALNTDYFINKGAVSAAPAITGVTKGAVSGNAADGYKLEVTAKGSIGTPTVTPGYVKEADVNITAITDKVESLDLGKAVIGASVSGLGLSATGSTTIAQATGESKFYVKPTLGGGNAIVKASVTTAGWAGTDLVSSGTSVSVDDKDVETFYIKEGTTQTLTGASTEVKLSSNLSSTVAGAYTIQVAANEKAGFTGNIDSGYYGENSTVAISQPVTGSISIAHGKVDVAATSAKVTIAASALELVTPTEGTGLTTDKLFKIDASTNDLALSLGASTVEGYVKTSDITLATSVSGNSSVYIKNYAKVQGDTDVASVTYNEESVYEGATVIDEYTVLNTKGTYVDKNIRITLGADAVGSNAVADLEKLQQRLNGTLARANA